MVPNPADPTPTDATQRAAHGAVAQRLRRIVFLLSAPLLGWIALSLTATWWWPGELASHWALHAALLLLPAAVVLRGDRRLCGCVMLAIMLGALPLLRAAWQPRAPLPAPTGAALRLMHANIYYGSSVPAAAIPGLAASEADLLSLVEAGPEDQASLRADPRWPYQHWSLGEAEGHPGLRIGVALCSRRPFVDIQERWDGDLTVIDAVVAVGDRRLRILVCHPRSPQSPAQLAERDRQLDLLARSVAGATEPVIVVGDLNCSPASPTWHRFCAKAGLRPASGSLPATWPTWFGPAGIAIDHVLAGGGAGIGDLDSWYVRGSDHRGLTARIGF